MGSQKNNQYLVRKAAKLARELSTILDELAASTNEESSPQPKTKGTAFDSKELRGDYERLRTAAEESENIEVEVSRFVEASTKERLRAFLAANALPIEGNASKQLVTSQLTQLLRQSKAISAPVSPLSKVNKPAS